MSIPHCSPPVWPSPLSPERFAGACVRRTPDGCSVGLIGLPDDTGVRLNNGRPGAAGGPAALRAALCRYGVAEPAGVDWPAVFDSGDVRPGADIHETHERVSEAVAAMLDLDLLPVAIGGGHDLTFPFVRAVAARCQPMAGVYLDAHLDVRPEVGSGMPFRKLVEDCGVQELHVHGLDMFANTREHVAWFNEHGGRVDAFTPDHAWPERDTFVSVDLDVLDAAYAPGVSALNPCGWSPERVCTWAKAAGRNPRVRCFDIMELNPAFDVDGRTARVAARIVLSFLAGLSERGTP